MLCILRLKYFDFLLVVGLLVIIYFFWKDWNIGEYDFLEGRCFLVGWVELGWVLILDWWKICDVDCIIWWYFFCYWDCSGYV